LSPGGFRRGCQLDGHHVRSAPLSCRPVLRVWLLLMWSHASCAIRRVFSLVQLFPCAAHAAHHQNPDVPRAQLHTRSCRLGVSARVSFTIALQKRGVNPVCSMTSQQHLHSKANSHDNTVPRPTQEREPNEGQQQSPPWRRS
jgi:hypothetical protein